MLVDCAANGTSQQAHHVFFKSNIYNDYFVLKKPKISK